MKATPRCSSSSTYSTRYVSMSCTRIAVPLRAAPSSSRLRLAPARPLACNVAAAAAAAAPCAPTPAPRLCAPPSLLLPPPRAASDAAAPRGDGGSGGGAPSASGGFEADLAAFMRAGTNLFPLWVVLAAILGLKWPPLFLWFKDSWFTGSLMAVMLGMGLTLTFEEMGAVFTRQPGLLLLGMALQYTVLPAIGWGISKFWGLTSSLAIGVALVSCMPGGTASNIVAYIAKGDMPLSVMMTTASTLLAVFTTPLLTSLLVGTLVPVDPKAMFLSTLQLVLVPVLAGAALNQLFPTAVARARAYTPFLATVIVVLIVGSMIASNVPVVLASGFQIISAVFVLHSSGFFLGYTISKALGLPERICRTNSIEVGMQSSALAAVLAKVHFPHDPVIVAPCVLSACTHATIGSLLAGVWGAQSAREEEAARGGGSGGGGTSSGGKA